MNPIGTKGRTRTEYMLVTIVDRIDLGRHSRKVAIRIDVTASRRNRVGNDEVTAIPCQHDANLSRTGW
jgi:hypothetical protein